MVAQHSISNKLVAIASVGSKPGSYLVKFPGGDEITFAGLDAAAVACDARSCGLTYEGESGRAEGIVKEEFPVSQDLANESVSQLIFAVRRYFTLPDVRQLVMKQVEENNGEVIDVLGTIDHYLDEAAPSRYFTFSEMPTPSDIDTILADVKNHFGILQVTIDYKGSRSEFHWTDDLACHYPAWTHVGDGTLAPAYELAQAMDVKRYEGTLPGVDSDPNTSAYLSFSNGADTLELVREEFLREEKRGALHIAIVDRMKVSHFTRKSKDAEWRMDGNGLFAATYELIKEIDYRAAHTSIETLASVS